MRRINEIFIHCTATKPNWMEGHTADQKAAEIRRWHVEGNGWSDIGYHFVIDRNGDTVKGRPIEKSGAHVRGHNKHSIGISLVGGWGSSADDKFKENFTDAQEKALDKLLHDLTTQFPHAKIRGHNEVANKACPGFWVKEYLDGKPSPTRSKEENVQEGSSSNTANLSGIVNLLVGVLGKRTGR